MTQNDITSEIELLETDKLSFSEKFLDEACKTTKEMKKEQDFYGLVLMVILFLTLYRTLIRMHQQMRYY